MLGYEGQLGMREGNPDMAPVIEDDHPFSASARLMQVSVARVLIQARRILKKN